MDELTRELLAARAGDRLAFAAVVRRAQADVWRYSAHLIGRDEADDLTQETFVRVVRALPGVPGRGDGAYVVARDRAPCLCRCGAPQRAGPAARRGRGRGRGRPGRARRVTGRGRRLSARRAGRRPTGRVRAHPAARPVLCGGRIRVQRAGRHDSIASCAGPDGARRQHPAQRTRSDPPQPRAAALSRPRTSAGTRRHA